MNQNKYLTKYEKTRLIGLRALQISMGSPIMVDVPEGITDPITIAEIELSERKIPMIIQRDLPSGKKIKIPLEKFIIL